MGKPLQITEFIYGCGKCNEGIIIVTHKHFRKSMSLKVNKCTNGDCRCQYGIKEITKDNLKEVSNG